jgi:imidazolonepropionase-like amidohydrolase
MAHSLIRATAVALSTLACATPGPPASPLPVDAPAPALAIVDVTVIPMTHERTLAHHTVILRGGRIEALGPASTLPSPPDARVVDGRGRYLLPALMDMHTHLTDSVELGAYAAHGVGLVRNMWGNPTHLEWRAAQRQGRLFAPELVTSGPMIDGAPPAWPGAAVVTTPQQARREVQLQQEAGYDLIKAYDHLSPEVWHALVDEAQRLGMKVAGHPPIAVGVTQAVQGGQVSVEHLYGIEALAKWPEAPPARVDTRLERRQAWRAVDPARLDNVAQALAAAKAWVCPTLVTFHHFVPRPEADRRYRGPNSRLDAPSWWRKWDPNVVFERPVTAELARHEHLANQARQKTVAALHRAGVRLLLGTDAGNPYVRHGAAVAEELELLVQAGLTPLEALRTATSGPAEYLGRLGERGAIAPGLVADLILVGQDPLAEVGTLRRPEAVILGGRYYDRAELDRRLQALAEGLSALRP